jgi:ribose 5-phosphate isomerase B
MGDSKRVAVASDHAGFELKEFVSGYLLSKGYAVYDCGCYDTVSVDYPDFAHALAQKIEAGDAEFGVALCGTANGVSMTLNRHAAVRAALCWRADIARLSREHNDANVCSIPARYTSPSECADILDAFFSAQFEGGRHTARVNKI